MEVADSDGRWLLTQALQTPFAQRGYVREESEYEQERQRRRGGGGDKQRHAEDRSDTGRWGRRRGNATGESIEFYRPPPHHGPAEGGFTPSSSRGWRTTRSEADVGPGSGGGGGYDSGRSNDSSLMSSRGADGGGGGRSSSLGAASERELLQALVARRMERKRAEHQRRLSPSSAARGAWDPPAAGSPSGDDPSGPARATDPKAFHRQHPITNYDVFNSNAFQPKPCQPLPVRQTSYLCGRT